MSANPASLPTAGGAERRRDVRFVTRELTAVIYTDGELLCLMTDISAGGAMLEGKVSFELQTRLELAFDEFIGLEGKVVYRGDGFCGVQFLHKEDERLRLVNWIRRRALVRAGKPGG